MENQSNYEVIIVGGSYAGLSAAMTLGRSRRKVLVIDNGRPCNRQTPHAHNLIGHDGDRPADFARKAREQVAAYPTVTFASATATGISGDSGGFEIAAENGDAYRAKRILLATGVKDIPLPIPGFAECWGISALHCPYCHGYEVAGRPMGVIANGEMAFEFARLIQHWSADLTLFTDGPSSLPVEQAAQLREKGIRIVENEIESMQHRNGRLQALQFRDGSNYSLEAVFARGGIAQYDFVGATGCELHSEGMLKGLLKVDDFGKTSRAGIYAAGDNSTPMRSLSMAMSAGMKAAAVMNNELIGESF